jgi:hypothetical protein
MENALGQMVSQYISINSFIGQFGAFVFRSLYFGYETGHFFLLPVCRLCWFFYTLNIYVHFSSHFSQQLLMTEIWYLETGSRNPMGSKTLPTIWGTYMKLVTKYQISAINSCWEKCDEKCAYMFNVIYAHISSHFSQQLLMTEIWYLVTIFI